MRRTRERGRGGERERRQERKERGERREERESHVGSRTLSTIFGHDEIKGSSCSLYVFHQLIDLGTPLEKTGKSCLGAWHFGFLSGDGSNEWMDGLFHGIIGQQCRV
jgi:hypothetical protein